MSTSSIALRLGCLAVTALVSLSTVPASAQTCNTTCMGAAGSGMTCTVTVTGLVDGGCGISTIFFGGGSAQCNVGAAGDLMAMATHAPTSPTTAPGCVFSFRAFTNTTTCDAGPSVFCTINSGDGLPVELMEFEVDAKTDLDDEADDDSDSAAEDG